jgi:hypothetical protein
MSTKLPVIRQQAVAGAVLAQVPALFVPSPAAVRRFLEFFGANIRNPIHDGHICTVFGSLPARAVLHVISRRSGARSKAFSKNAPRIERECKAMMRFVRQLGDVARQA